MMPPTSLRTAARIYNWLLGLYPAPFRARFRAEMLQVFRSLSRDIYGKGGLSGLLRFSLALASDQFGALIQQWRQYFIGRKGLLLMNTPSDNHLVRPLSPLEAVLGALPFFGFGLSRFVDELPYLAFLSAKSSFWQVILQHPTWIIYWLVLAGLGAGILLGFPRWAYAYLGWALLLTWSHVNTRYYGHDIDATVWLLPAAVMLASLIIKRSLQPLKKIWQGIKNEWTLISLGLAIFYSFPQLLYDSNHHPFLLGFIASSTLVVSLGVWGYFRSRRPVGRVVTLLGGLFVAMLLSEISYSTWAYAVYYGLPQRADGLYFDGLYFFAPLALLMLAPALAARRREARQV